MTSALVLLALDTVSVSTLALAPGWYWLVGACVSFVGWRCLRGKLWPFQ